MLRSVLPDPVAPTKTTSRLSVIVAVIVVAFERTEVAHHLLENRAFRLIGVGIELIDSDIDDVRSPLGQALRAADEQASMEMLQASDAFGSIDLAKLAH